MMMGDETHKLTVVCLLYIKDLSEKIQTICSPHDIRTVLKCNRTLRKYLQVKPPIEENISKDCVSED